MDHVSASSYARATNFQKCTVFIWPPCIYWGGFGSAKVKVLYLVHTATPTRQDTIVLSCRRRRCELGISFPTRVFASSAFTVVFTTSVTPWSLSSSMIFSLLDGRSSLHLTTLLLVLSDLWSEHVTRVSARCENLLLAVHSGFCCSPPPRALRAVNSLYFKGANLNFKGFAYDKCTGRIIKSVCVCESVSESVTQNELNALQIAILHRSSPNLPPR